MCKLFKTDMIFIASNIRMLNPWPRPRLAMLPFVLGGPTLELIQSTIAITSSFCLYFGTFDIDNGMGLWFW